MVGRCCCIMIGLCVGAIVFTTIMLVYFLVINKVVYTHLLVNYKVTNASLTEFNLSTTTTSYNLTLDVFLRNPNDLDIHFERLEAAPVYKDQTINNQTANLLSDYPFELKPDGNATFPALFTGNNNSVDNLGSPEWEINDRLFDVVLKISGKYWYKSRNKKVTVKQELGCYLRVPRNFNGTNGGESFQITKCDQAFLEFNKD